MEEADTETGDAEAETRGMLSLVFSPTRLVISPSRAVLNWRMRLANNGDAHIVALRIWSELASAHRSEPGRDQLRGPDMQTARLHTADIVAPGDGVDLSGEWQIERGAMRAIGTPAEPLLLPLVRLRMIGAGMLPDIRTLAVGMHPAGEGDRVRPIPLKGDMQVHSRLAAQPIG